MDEPIFIDNKKIDDITDILKEIGKSEESFKKGYYFMSFKDIRNKIEESVLKKPKEAPKTVLGTSEKIRYGKIGDSFIKGSQNYFEEMVSKIQKEEKRKNKIKKENSKKKIYSGESKKEFKFKKKKSKAGTVVKIGLVAAALGATVYGIKQIYDYIIENTEAVDIAKKLLGYIPKTISFFSAGTKFVNGKMASFVLTTTDGEEVSLSEGGEKNVVEGAAAEFDDIIQNQFLKGGFNQFLNSMESGASAIGYLLFKPIEKFVNLTKDYIIENIRNPKIGRIYLDVYGQISIITNWLTGHFRKQYVSKYSTLLLSSKDLYTNAIADLSNVVNGILGSRNSESSSINLGVYVDGRELSIGSSKSARDVVKDAEELIRGVAKGDSEKFLKLISSLTILKTNYEIAGEYESWNTKETYAKNTLRIKNGHIETENKEVQDPFFYFMGIIPNLHMNQSGIAKTQRIAAHDKEAFNEKKADAARALYNTFQKFNNAAYSTRTSLLKAATALLYNEVFLEDKEDYLSKQEHYLTMYNETYRDNYIENKVFFDGSLTTEEKLAIITDSYFNGKNKHKNFFLKVTDKMENIAEEKKNSLMIYFEMFKHQINPYEKFFISLNFGGDNKKDLKDFVKSYFKDNKTTLITEFSDKNLSHQLASIEYQYMSHLVNYKNQQLNFRQEKNNLLEKVIEKLSAKDKNIKKKTGKKKTVISKNIGKSRVPFKRRINEREYVMEYTTVENYEYEVKDVDGTIEYLDFSSIN